MTLGELVSKKASAKDYDFSSSDSSNIENHNDVQEEIQKLKDDLFDSTEKTEIDFNDLQDSDEK